MWRIPSLYLISVARFTACVGTEGEKIRRKTRGADLDHFTGSVQGIASASGAAGIAVVSSVRLEGLANAHCLREEAFAQLCTRIDLGYGKGIGGGGGLARRRRRF